jgi:2-polyprenyl-3-methyl-5-hydroxy-6-metoxy-1,4-benzoquinol methylase
MGSGSAAHLGNIDWKTMSQNTTAKEGQRWDVAPREVEQLEAEWWDKYAWLEDEYAWVHPPKIRSLLRKHYIRYIVANIPKGGTIVDFGCGPGWLAILLAQLGARHVIGIDNAPAQIAIARRKAKEVDQENRISFFDTIDAQTLRTADAVVIHGVLHHLSGNEIDAFTALVHAHIREDCKLFILEPVQGNRRYLPWSLPYHAVRFISRLRPQSPEEKRIRALLESRGDGPRYPGYGVAPKEMPFQVGELERRLGERFDVTRGRPVLFFSVRVVMELLLAAKTFPRSVNICLRLGLPLYMVWERFSFMFAPAELWSGWVFCLFEAKPRTGLG